MTEPTCILLITAADDVRRRWMAALSSADCLVQASPDASRRPQVIITDRPADESMEHLADELTSGDIGVINVGIDEPADVSLPHDATDRELRLACLLLTQIVSLRRRHHEDQRVRRVLGHLAMSDPLTGLPNRRAWEDEARRRVETRDAGGLCIALLDLDRFKAVNDTLGHAAGDDLLVATARAMSASLRPGDFVARLGGDEFALLISGVTPAAAHAVVERVRVAVAQAASTQAANISASVGYVVGEDGNATTLLAAADAALRDAKADGRNCSHRATL